MVINNIFDCVGSNTYIVNPVNCVGVMGKGLALEFKSRYPDMFQAYSKACKQGLIRPGIPAIYKNIILFPTKDHWRNPSQYEWISAGCKRLARKLPSGTHVAFPPVGCGLGGLEQARVKEIITQAFADTGIEVIFCGFKPNDRVLECSSVGDKRFSALYAKVSFNGVLGSIERHYQSAKFDRNNKPCHKGAKVDHCVICGKKVPATYLTALYRYLWYTYLRQHQDLVAYARTFNDFNDRFRGKSINCQADCVRAFVKRDTDFYKCIISFAKEFGLTLN